MNITRNEIPWITKTPNPRASITMFVLLCFLFSVPWWYLLARLPVAPRDQTRFLLYTMALMWCPGMAAIFTRLWFQRNLQGFGFQAGRMRWLLVGMLLPVIAGLLMFGSAWIFGVAPFDASRLGKILSPSFIPILLIGLGFNCFVAFGEELGWRGFLVPELSRCMKFTRLAFVSGAIWTVWHFPLIIFGSYHGAGSLWYSLAAFVPLIMASGFVQAWLRLASGSIWVAMLLHGFWNYFIQGFYPLLTQKTPAGEKMLGEFGWAVGIISVLLALGFWRFRNRLPGIPQ